MPAALLENLPPGVFGVAKDRTHEFGALIIGRRRLARLVGGRCRLLAHLAGQFPEDLHRVLAGKPADPDDQNDCGQAQAFAATKAHSATAADSVATGIDHVVTASAFFP
ncbi:hypothetical protein D3C84_865420 [compost metagenome]